MPPTTTQRSLPLLTLPLLLHCTQPPPTPAPTRSPAPATSAVPTPAPATTPAPTLFLTAAIGDSLTAARPPNYLTHLQKLCPQSRFDNFGVGGNMVNQMRARFERDVLAADRPRYTHLIVFGGVNDLYSDLSAGRTVALIQRDLMAMYERARSAGMRVIAVNVAPWGGFKRYFNSSRQAATLELNRWILAQPAAGTVRHAIDAYALLSCGDPERLCPELEPPFKDGLHFGPAGHASLARALHGQVFSNCL